MEIVAIITGGLIAMTALAGLFDVLGKRAKASAGGPALQARLEALEARQRDLEAALAARDGEVQKLGQDLAFMSRLLEDKRPEAGRSPH